LIGLPAASSDRLLSDLRANAPDGELLLKTQSKSLACRSEKPPEKGFKLDSKAKRILKKNEPGKGATR